MFFSLIFYEPHRNFSRVFAWQPVGLEESKRKSDWVRTDFDDFEGQ